MIAYFDPELTELSRQAAVIRARWEAHLRHCQVCGGSALHLLGTCDRRTQLERELAAANALVAARNKHLRRA